MKTYSKPVSAKVLLIIFPIVLLVSAGLGYWLFYGGARPVVDAYVAAVRADKSTKPLQPDGDSKAANKIIAKSTDLTITNFATRSGWNTGTGCYSGRLTTSDGSVDVAFYVEKKDDGWHVAKVSTTKKCQCPKNSDCSLR